MTLIEGVGDEVTHFFIIVIVLLVGWFAWYSTSITDQPLIHTVLVLHRRRTRLAELRTNHPNVSSFTRPPNLEVTEEETIQEITDDNNDNTQVCPEPTIADTNDSISTETHRTSEAAATEEVLIEAMDSFNSDGTTLLQRRTKINCSKETDVPKTACTESVEHVAENLATSDANKISIKLKFINDDQKMVTGSLKELLGDFKRRHFQTELEAQKLVRFVFNGRVLQPDNQTLEQCGLYNNCVVHCLIHQPRPNPVPSQTPTIDNSSSIYFNPQSFSDIPVGTGISSWDLSRPLVIILTIMLGFAWYSRFHYAQFFTAGTTFALYALTAIFAMSVALILCH